MCCTFDAVGHSMKGWLLWDCWWVMRPSLFSLHHHILDGNAADGTLVLLGGQATTCLTPCSNFNPSNTLPKSSLKFNAPMWNCYFGGPVLTMFFWNIFPLSLPPSLSVLLSPSVPTASMTRLVRSRTHSSSSMGSVDGPRSRTHTNSQLEGATAGPAHDAQNQPQTMEVSC